MWWTLTPAAVAGIQVFQVMFFASLSSLFVSHFVCAVCAGRFKVSWQYVKDLSHKELTAVKVSSNDGKPVWSCKDGQV